MVDIKDFLDNEGRGAAGPTSKLTEHYYGDLVRKLFMSAAVVMLVGLPFVYDNVPIPLFISLLAILVIGILAGLTNPKNFLIMFLNTLIALVAVVAFEFFAVSALIKNMAFFFVANQLLALIFLFALYYSTKSWRGKLLK